MTFKKGFHRVSVKWVAVPLRYRYCKYLQNVGVHGNVKIGPLLDGPEKGLTGGAPRASPDSALKIKSFCYNMYGTFYKQQLSSPANSKRTKAPLLHMSQSELS